MLPVALAGIGLNIAGGIFGASKAKKAKRAKQSLLI